MTNKIPTATTLCLAAIAVSRARHTPLKTLLIGCYKFVV